MREQVPFTARPEGLWIVRDQELPQPWREWFNVASIDSTRVEQGFYQHDWLSFLPWWEREMAHFESALKGANE